MNTASMTGDFGFEPARCVVAHVETHPDRWCVGFLDPNGDGNPRTWVVDRDPDQLARTLSSLGEQGKTLVTYNGDRFGVPIIRATLAGLDPYPICRRLIEDGRLSVPPNSLPPLPCDHIDLSARLRRGGKFPSLERVAANLGRPRLRELPYPPGTTLDDGQWAEVLDHNTLDLQHTRAILEYFAPELQALAVLGQEQGQDLRSVPTPRVVERVFRNAFRREVGSEPVRPEPPQEVIYRAVTGVRRPTTVEAAAWYDRVVEQPLVMIRRDEHRYPDVPTARFKIGALKVAVGAGGLHSVDAPRVHYETRKALLLSVDVASYYPSLIAGKGISPAAYGPCGAATYAEILTRRLEVKKAAKSAEDPAERERLGVQAEALKLILNTTFGNLGNPYSSLYDPGAMLAVTLTGQIMLIDLIERLTAGGVRVLSANTDGLFLEVRKGDRSWREIRRGWEADTGMTLEVERLRRLAILATNRVATLDRAGTIKRRGAGVKGDLSPTAVPNALVVADATVEALLRDVPPERTVRACRDAVRFCFVSTRTAKVESAVLRGEGGPETELPGVTRWYKTRGSTQRIEHRWPDGNKTTPANAVGVALDLTDGMLPEGLDYSWYMKEARRAVQKVPGYRHRSKVRLSSHAAATEVFERGLLPVPKRGKAQPTGSDPRAPTLLWDWPNYPTVGTYTGPEVGILVVDVDDCARFRTWVDKNGSPLLAHRRRDLDGCLVSCRGDHTPDRVRNGQGRGKLIFRLEGDGSHPLAKVPISRWKASRGLEVFYGKGLPSVLGAHPDGTQYRLDGALGPAPGWLVEELTPRTRPRSPAGAPRCRNTQGPGTGGVDPEAVREMLEGLPKQLAELAPELGRVSVGWRSKELGEGRSIWVGRCPFEHDSGSSSDADLSAGHGADGRPYVLCKHSSCVDVPAIDGRLKRAFRPRRVAATMPPPMEPTAIALAFERDLADGMVAFHAAPTGSGKSHSIAQAAILRYRAGGTTLIAVPTVRIAEETLTRLREFAPDAFEVEAVASIFGNRRRPVDEHAEVDPDSNPEDRKPGEYPIRARTRIVVCTHDQIGRRGFSKFMRAIWAKLAPLGGEDDNRPAFDLIIDEAAELIRACRLEFPLAHRVTSRRDPDRSGGTLTPLQDCPKSNRSGNCGNCRLRAYGGEIRYNPFSIRELGLPRPIEFDAGDAELRRPHRPLAIPESDFRLESPKIRVGHTTFASGVLDWRGVPIDADARRTAPLPLFRKNKEGGQPPETPAEVLGHILRFGFRPAITWEYPIDVDGDPIDPSTLKRRIDRADRSWDENIVFPRDTCEVPRLRFADLATLEKMRRYALEHKAGIVFTGTAPSRDDEDVLREVWPELTVRSHPYPARKIRRAAVVFVEDYHGVGSVVDDGRRLVTRPLEAIGMGVVFCATRRAATALYEQVKLEHPSVRMADGNDERISVDCRKTLHAGADLGCYVTYSRGVLGLGANLKGVRFLLVDARAFRAIASFTPGEVTPEAFERARAEERLALLMQNLGRALRGEEGKTAVLIVLNADPDLIDAIKVAPAIVEGSELPPVFATGKDLIRLVDQSRRWLETGGGDWPEADRVEATGKRRGRKAKRTKQTIFAAAERAGASGVSWRDFVSREQPRRTLDEREMEGLKALFANRR